MLCRLVRNGNSTQVTIPRRLLEHLRWRTGDRVAVELTERGTLEVRTACALDLRDDARPARVGDALESAGVRA